MCVCGGGTRFLFSSLPALAHSPPPSPQLRVILPGHIGGRTVKWLTAIEVADTESKNWYHCNDNRVPPPHVLTPEDAVREGVWENPDW